MPTTSRGRELVAGSQRFVRRPGLVARLVAPGIGKIIDRIDRELLDAKAESFPLFIVVSYFLVLLCEYLQLLNVQRDSFWLITKMFHQVSADMFG